MLEVDSLTVREPGGRAILEGVSLAAAPGEIVAVLGPNGAGKTTLLEAIVGLRIGEGVVRWRSDRLEGFGARADVFAFMPDDAILPEELTVRDFLGGEHGQELGLEPLWDRSAGELSRGEAKRVWMAWTLLRDRPILVLDEPFGAFDPLQLEDVLDVIRARAKAGVTVLVSVHQMTTAERIASRLALVAEGRLIALGTLNELRAQAKKEGEATLEEVFRALIGEARAPRA